MLFLLRLDRGAFAFATTIVVVIAAIGTVVILVNPQSPFNVGTLSGLVVFHAGGPPSPPGDCSNRTTTSASAEIGPVMIVAQPQSMSGTSIDIPIHWTSGCVLGARLSYGSIQVNLIPGNYTLHLDCSDGSPIGPHCDEYVNPSLITVPNGETYQTQGNTFILQITGNKTTTMDIDIASTIF
jgi:hypothetical protein